MNLTTQRLGGTMVVRPELARLDATMALQFKDKVGDLIAGGERSLVLDLARVDFVDSSGLGALVALLKRMGAEGSLALASVRPPVARLLALTRLDRVFRIHDTVQGASEALAGGRPS